jgi:hypothetical protein
MMFRNASLALEATTEVQTLSRHDSPMLISSNCAELFHEQDTRPCE